MVGSALTAAAVLTASRIVYRGFAPGLEVPAASISHAMAVLLLLVVLMLVATLIATRRGRGGLGSGALWLRATIALVAPIYAALVLVSPVHAHAAAAIRVPPLPWPLRCLGLSAVVGVLICASFAVALRRSVPVGSRLRGAALGAAAGAWAGLSVFVFCPSANLQHLFIGHVLPIVALTLLGMITVPRIVRL